MQPSSSTAPFHHLLSLETVTRADFARLAELADGFYAHNRTEDKKQPLLRGRTQVNLFYENSTRTRSSFELAGKRLGMDVININSSVSAVSKGESLIDTARTLAAMRPDILVLRHPQSGAAALMADEIGACRLINAGDGCHQHPTQALLDAYVMQQRKGRIDGLRVAICGDIAHSRVARSNVALLKTLGASVCLIAPKQWMPAGAERLGCDLSYRLTEGIAGADVVMPLRVQTERMTQAAIPSAREYYHLYGLTHARLAYAKPDALVLHPGPLNRGVEIDTALADDRQRTGIADQVEAGVAIRQALMVWMLGGDRE